MIMGTFTERPPFDSDCDVYARHEVRIGRVWSAGEGPIPWRTLAVSVHLLEVLWSQGLIDTIPNDEVLAARKARLLEQRVQERLEVEEAKAALAARQAELDAEKAKTDADAAKLAAEAEAIVDAEMKKEQEERELAALQAEIDAMEKAEADAKLVLPTVSDTIVIGEAKVE